MSSSEQDDDYTAAGVPKVPPAIEGTHTMYEVMRPVMLAWYAKKMGESAAVPKPRDAPISRSDDPDADSVLLFGNGAAHGWGVVTHDLALTGQLARVLQSATERPTSVNYIGDETMNVSAAIAWLGEHDVSPYDLVVSVLGMNDAVRLTSVATWESQLAALLTKLSAGMKLHARIVVVGIQPVRSVTAYDTPLGAIAEIHARRLNQVTQEVIRRFPEVTYFRLSEPTLEADRPHGSRKVYGAWAKTVAEWAAPALDACRAEEGNARRARGAADIEWDWSGSPHLIASASTGGSDELQRLATLAQETFDVDVAVVSLLNGDRLWYAMNTDRLPRSIPRQLAYCDVTVTQDQPLVVPDARRDDRFRGNPFIDVTGMNFYAGHPLHSSTGQAIGTFCLLNRRPRPESSVSLDALRDMALQAQSELWKYETPPADRITPAPLATIA